MRDHNTPTLSFVGLCLFTITLIANLCFKFVRTSDVGIGMLLSLANALLLVFTLLWSVMGIIELRILIRLHKNNKSRFEIGNIDKDEYMNKSKRLKFCFTINTSYLVIIFCQLGYVFYNWDEVNI
jgi:hypothetical protein